MEERMGIEASVRERAQRDEEFRTALLADGRAALGEMLGVEIPASLTIRVIEEAADEVVLVVPEPRPAVEDLGDEELETQSGAGGWSFFEQHCQATGSDEYC